MILSSLDKIVRRNLLEKSMPLHWWLEYFLHAAAGLREMSFDSLQIINTVSLPINSYSAFDMPDDFVDDVAVCIPMGQFLRPIPKNDSINPIRITDTTGNFIPYSDAATNPQTAGLTFFDFSAAGYWFWNINDFGEPTGRYFGGTGGDRMNGYKKIKARRQIQLTETYQSDSAILIYISDGSRADDLTQIDVEAFAAIQAYINWKRSPNADMKDSPEARTFYNERRLLRARLNEMSVTDLRNLIHSTYSASIKN